MKPVAPAAALIVVFLACASCAALQRSPDALPDIKPGQRPSLQSDEAGLWMQMDRVEAGLRTSGQIVADARLNAYVREVVCRLAGPYCADIRIYIVETPYFNASMAPNGTMQVWTGLLLRAQNEAQLAYVLGHEIGHFQRRHSLQIWRDIRSKSDSLVFFRVLTAAAGAGFAGDLAQLAALASIYAFSRDNEREADDVGFELLAKAGYNPHEAARIWEGLLKEQAASPKGKPSIFFATHPPTEERIATLKTRAQQATAGGQPVTVGKERLLAAVHPFRSLLLRDELRRREFAETQALLDRLFENGAGLGELHFFQGELYRLRAKQGDEQKAVAAYDTALEFGDAPADVHRALGLLLSRAGDKAKARSAYERYLQLKPDAEDREMVRSYLRQLE
nr:M48 family metalloprotease [Nitrospirota bacterium]